MIVTGECDKRKEKLLQLQRSKLERHMKEMDTLKKVCVCERMRRRHSVCVCVCVCACVCVCVCVCVCEREGDREREHVCVREKEGVCMSERVCVFPPPLDVQPSRGAASLSEATAPGK